jgi:hypothetical protein
VIPTLPLNLVQSIDRRLVASVAVSQSPFTGTQQVQDWGAEWWEYQIEMAVTQGANARRLSAFFAALGGARGTFLMQDPSAETPAGVGTPYVSEAAASGNVLATAGWGAAMRAGDFFQLGSDATTRLYQLTADVEPVAGAATIEFVPALRAAVALDTDLVVTAPKVRLRLTSPVPTRIGRVDKHLFSFSAREAL